MTPKPVTSLGYALLGLIRQQPRTGYALRKVFETTPMGSYSSSPGSIYPALAGLERLGLIEARDDGDDRKARGKGLFHLTPAGSAAFGAWLAGPVDGKDLTTAMLRFSFLRAGSDRALIDAFLDSFEAAATQQAGGLRQFLAGEIGRAMPLQSRLAVEYGCRQFEAGAQWAVWAKTVLRGD